MNSLWILVFIMVRYVSGVDILSVSGVILMGGMQSLALSMNTVALIATTYYIKELNFALNVDRLSSGMRIWREWKMNEIKLKPCPFCWSENVRLMSNETEDGSPCCINSDDELEAKYSYVHCYGCDMDFARIAILQKM